MEKILKTILCYGDSNTYGYNPDNGLRYPVDIRWTGQLQKLLDRVSALDQSPYSYTVLNEGCNGRTAAGIPDEEPWKNGRVYLEACLNTHKPIDMMIIMLGSNDLKKRFSLTSSFIADSVIGIARDSCAFLQLKQGFAPEVLIAAPALLGQALADPFCRSPFKDNFDITSLNKSAKLSRALDQAASKAGFNFIDTSALVEASDRDCLHLTARAHEILGQAFASAVQSILK